MPESETGSATGFYQVVRYIGFSLGSALAASVLASETPAGSQLPKLAGYTTVTWIGIVICVFAAVLAWVMTGRDGRSAVSTAAEPQREEEESALASAGLPGLGSD